MSTEIGLRIKALRRLKHVTQQELARKVNISVTMLSNIETGQKIPHPQLLQNIASSLSVPDEELLFLSPHDAGTGPNLNHSRAMQ